MFMTKITLKDNSTIDVTVRNATQNDIPNLMLLNQKWQKSVLGENIKDGFVGAAFSKETFAELIHRKQITVTDFDNKVIGYYLLNNFSKDGIIGRHEDFVTMLKQKDKISKSSNICVGAQAVVDTEFMGSGIRPLMLDTLVENMKGKYEYLFATIAKDNPRAFKAHTRDGWTVVDEEESMFYVVFKV